MKLINKDILVNEIESRKEFFYNLSSNCKSGTPAKSGFYAQAQTLEGILSFINTLEVKEVDLEKEVRNFLNDNPTSQNVQDLIKKYVSDHADCRWLDASELEQLLNDFVLEYDIIKNREYEQQCKVSNDGNNR